MEIEVEKKVSSKEFVNVIFPIYRQCDVGEYGTTIYSKVNIDTDKVLTIYSIWVDSDKNKIEMDIERNYLLCGDDYSLGNGVYESSEKQFNEAFECFNAFLNLINKGT